MTRKKIETFKDALHQIIGWETRELVLTNEYKVYEKAANLFADSRLRATDSERDELLAACKKLIDADHYEHFAVRLNDQEMEGIEAIKKAIQKSESAKIKRVKR